MIGVDFGTSTSLLARSTALRNAVIPLGRLNRWVPSIAGLEGFDWYLCDEASGLPETQIVRSAKRLITQRKPTARVSDGKQIVEVSADEVIVSILRHLVDLADGEFLDLTMAGEVRLGCPAMWDGSQRQRLVELANRAGINVGSATVIDEPIAAGVEWVQQRVAAGVEIVGKVVVFDMGGGTLDVAVLNVNAGPRRDPAISVQSAVGIDEAGDSLDEALADQLELLMSQAGLNIAQRPDADELRGWLRHAARSAKVELTRLRETRVVVGHPSVDFPAVSLSREELDDRFRPQLEEAIEEIWHALRSALMAQVKSPTNPVSTTISEARSASEEMLAENLTAVILAGGMARVPLVQNRVAEIFGADRVFLGTGEDTVDDLIALGLANDTSYERMNLHRPGFDFVIEWGDDSGIAAGEQLVYPAYLPLYSAQSAIQTNSAKYRSDSHSWAAPQRGEGLLKVRAANGDPVSFRLDGHEIEGVRFRFGYRQAIVTLEPSGRVFIRDSQGYETSLRIAQWPVIRGRGDEALLIESVGDEVRKYPRVEDLPWHLKPYD